MLDDLLRTNLLHDVPNGHANIAFAIFAGVRLRRLAPAALPYQRDRGDARWVALAALRDARQDAQTHLGVRARQ